MPADIELLRIQAERSFDGAGRLRARHGVTIACSGEQQAMWIGAGVPDDIVADLTSAFARAGRARDPSEPPAALEHCRRILERSGGALMCKAGPGFVFPDDVRRGSNVPIIRCDSVDKGTLAEANPGNWHPVEWAELLDGQLGPWTMILEGRSAVAICHTPGPGTARAAECGVWTHPAFRGRGHATAVTAEWAAIMRSAGRHLFYSTDSDDASSRRVAERLGLRLIGWTWRLAPPSDHERGGLHPLCSVRREPGDAGVTAR